MCAIRPSPATNVTIPRTSRGIPEMTEGGRLGSAKNPLPNRVGIPQGACLCLPTRRADPPSGRDYRWIAGACRSAMLAVAISVR